MHHAPGEIHLLDDEFLRLGACLPAGPSRIILQYSAIWCIIICAVWSFRNYLIILIALACFGLGMHCVWTVTWLQNLYHFPNGGQACLFWEPQFVAWKCQQWCRGTLRPFAVGKSWALHCSSRWHLRINLQVGHEGRRMIQKDARLLDQISGCLSSGESVPWPNQCTICTSMIKHVHVCVWHICAAPWKAPQLEPWWRRFVRLHCWDLLRNLVVQWRNCVWIYETGEVNRDRCGKMLLGTSWIPSVHEGAAGTEALPPRQPPCEPAKKEAQRARGYLSYTIIYSIQYNFYN